MVVVVVVREVVGFDVVVVSTDVDAVLGRCELVIELATVLLGATMLVLVLVLLELCEVENVDEVVVNAAVVELVCNGVLVIWLMVVEDI